MFPIKNVTSYSCLQSTVDVEAIVDKAKEYRYTALGLCDKNNLHAVVHFYKACKKNKIKPIIGCELFTDDGKVSIFCKNKLGWKNLLFILGTANQNISRTSTWDVIKNHSDGLICVIGEIPSLFNNEDCFRSRNYQEVKSCVSEHWENLSFNYVQRRREIFGDDNLYIEQHCNALGENPHLDITNKILCKVAKGTNLKLIPTYDVRYINKEHAEIHRILLCSEAKTKLSTATKDISPANNKFFKSDDYFFPKTEQFYGRKENFKEFFESIEEFDILNRPSIPEFVCPDNMSAPDYLKSLARIGWKEKIKDKIPKNKETEYAERIKMELKVIEEANLYNYFLIVAEICDWAKSQGIMMAPGRGSACGCLLSYLINITDVDPIPFNLIFERFYNPGRNTKEKVSLPDIDCDFQPSRRDEVFAHIEEKYGLDRTSKITTFHTFKGRAALKEILSIKEKCSPTEMNNITKFIPDEAKISDQLQEMLEAEGESSIIRWALMHRASDLKPWCFIHEGKLCGDFAHDFEQAIMLEGIQKARSVHAAGIIISPRPLIENTPLIYDENLGKAVAALEMGPLEDLGHVKMDILSTDSLDILVDCEDMVNGRY